jgi:protein-disulfide isomerase
VIGVRLVALLMAGGLAACAARAAPVASATFTPQQRTQIVQILRDAMKRDPTILRDAIVVLQADNNRLEAQAQHAAIMNQKSMLFDSNDPSTGNPHGSVTIVEFFDPRCPYCRQLAPMLTRLVSKDGAIRLVYKDFPILGPASELGSRALLAAQLQGRYEALRAALMGNASTDFTLASIRSAAEKVGLDWPSLVREMNSAETRRKLSENKALAQTLGIDGTPTLVIGQKIIEGADIPTIAAAVVNARHDRSLDQSKPRVSLSTPAH